MKILTSQFGEQSFIMVSLYSSEAIEASLFWWASSRLMQYLELKKGENVGFSYGRRNLEPKRIKTNNNKKITKN